jgi:hypothetical protein
LRRVSFKIQLWESGNYKLDSGRYNIQSGNYNSERPIQLPRSSRQTDLRTINTMEIVTCPLCSFGFAASNILDHIRVRVRVRVPVTSKAGADRKGSGEFKRKLRILTRLYSAGRRSTTKNAGNSRKFQDGQLQTRRQSATNWKTV